MTLKTYLFLAYADTALLALLVSLAFYRFSLRQSHIKLIGLLLTVSIICNVSAYLLARFKTGLVNIPPSLYDMILMVILSLIYNERTGGRYKYVFRYIAIVFLVIALSNLLFIQKEEITSYTKFCGSVVIISYTVFYFYYLMTELPAKSLQSLPMFWFSSSFLVFYSGTIFLSAFTTYLIQVLRNDIVSYMAFHNILLITQHLIILVGLLADLKALPGSKRAPGRMVGIG